MSYQYSLEHFGLLEAEHDGPINLAASSRAERNVPAASTAHCTVNSVLGDGDGIRYQSESLFEYRHKLVLNSFRNIADMREQARFRYGPRDECEVIFDLFLVLDDGTRIAGDIKPEVRLQSGRHLKVLQEVAWWVDKKDFADEVRLYSDADLDPIDLFNAQVFSAVRDKDPEADAVAMAIAASLDGGQSLRDLTQITGMRARGYRALLRLVRDQALRSFSHTKITPDTIVAKATAEAVRDNAASSMNP